MTPIKHALLGASSAHRWLNCPPSARLIENMPDTQSPYAAAGTLAHEMAEFKARSYFLEPVSKRSYNTRMKRFAASENYDKDMDSATDEYLEHLKARAMSYPDPPTVALEVNVDFSDVVPEGFGTADCIMIGSGCLDVVDYKNGAGVVVEAENNPQMMLYAWGALRMFSMIFGDSIHTIHLSIVQPNAGGIKEWVTYTEDLDYWANVYVAERAEQAWRGDGEFNPGDWCRFCKAKATCSARAAKMLEMETQAGSIPENDIPADSYTPQIYAWQGKNGKENRYLLTDAEVGDILSRARGLAAWVKDLEDYALKAGLEGRKIDGWKVVEGRGTRNWIGGPDAAFPELLSKGVEEALLYERKPLSVAALEKELGKKAFSDIAEGLWEKTPGKPALVPESDARPAYNAAEIAFKKAEAMDK